MRFVAESKWNPNFPIVFYFSAENTQPHHTELTDPLAADQNTQNL